MKTREAIVKLVDVVAATTAELVCTGCEDTGPSWFKTIAESAGPALEDATGNLERDITMFVTVRILKRLSEAKAEAVAKHDDAAIEALNRTIEFVGSMNASSPYNFLFDGLHTSFLLSKRRVAIDFDGVLHDDDSGISPPPGRPVDGALDFVHLCRQQGFSPFVHTARAVTWEGREEVRAWLSHHGFPCMHVTAEKLSAVLYVDDRAARFRGSWTEVQNTLIPIHRPD